MREKIQASREKRVINLAVFAKIPATPAIPYLNKTAVIYLNNVVVIYPDKTAIIYLNKKVNLSELKNQWGIQLLRPKTFKRLGGIIREATNWPIYPGVNKEP